MKRKYPVLIVASLFMLACFSLPALSEDNKEDSYPFSINIDQPSIYLTTDPSSTKSGDIIVDNNGKSQIRIRAYAEDWTYAADGSKFFRKAGTTKDSCAKWIHLNPANFTLAPGRSQKVSYVMTTPQDAKGGRVAVIFFESTFEQKEGIVIGGRIGSIIYQETARKTTKDGEIVKFSVVPTKGRNVLLKVSLRNTGNAHIDATPKVEIYGKTKKNSMKFVMPRLRTLPGDIASVEKEYEIENKDAKTEDYTAVIKIDAGSEMLEEEATFSLQKSQK